MIRFTSIAKNSLILAASAFLVACGGGSGGGGLGSSNQAPVFSSGSGSVTTPENNTGVIYTAEAIDPDGSLAGFYISGGDDKDDFSLDAISGALRFKEAQDRENPSDANYDGIYVVEISVSDTAGAVSSLSLSVSLSDVDEAPIITAGQTLSVDENSDANTSVGSVIATNDGISVGLQGWQIVEDDSNGAFSINAASGEIAVAEGATLDYESATNGYTLGLTVSDGKFTSSVGDVVINVGDVNEPPVVKTEAFTVSEDIAAGAHVGYAVADDVDSASADIGNWTITDSTDSSVKVLFDINSANGQITLAQAGQLDYESATRSYTLTLTVSDEEYTSAEGTVEVIVADANDNNPIITQPESSFSIAENSAADASVGDPIAASDVDTNTTFQDWTITGGNTDDVFGINSVESDSGEIVGQIIVAKDDVLDVDAVGAIKSYSLEVTVGDGVNTSDPITVAVNITGVNDETPAIDPNQSFAVAENATSLEGGASSSICAVDGNSETTGYVGKLGVDDADADAEFRNWAIASDSSDGGFCIDPNNGYIYVADSSKLDYETDTIHELSITVEDGIYTSEQVIVDINLTDVNDNAPVIESEQSFSIAENIDAESTVGKVDFSDADTDDVNDFSWSITGGNENGLFAIDTSGQITTKAVFDYETDARTYTLNVEIDDGTNTPDQETVTVQIKDVNDNAPSIDADYLEFSVDENSASGTLVGTLVVSDADSAEVNAFTWSIDGGNTGGAFSIVPDSGELKVATAGALDYESDNKEYSLTVTVNDGSDAKASATVIVNITDVNDNQPVISDQSLSVDENATGSSSIGTLEVQDDDSDSVNTFTWAFANSTDLFTLDETSGELNLTASAALDYEDTTSYDLPVIVSDGDNNSEVKTITVNVGNVNDNAPVIEYGLSFDINENNSIDAVIGSVAFEDKDSDEVNTFAWSITGVTSGGSDVANYGTIFAIDDDTGEITAKSSLNHEDKDSYTLSVQVSDGDHSDTQDVTVNVIDVNDAPNASAEATDTNGVSINIDNSILIEGTVLWLDASSSSDEDGDELSYVWTQTEGPVGLAQLNSTTGKVVEFSGNNSAGDYQFNLTVTDDGGLTATASVGVSIAESALPDDFNARTGPLSGSVELTWTPYTEDETIYTIYRSNDDSCLPSNCTAHEEDSFSDVSSGFVDTGLTNLTPYYYVIEASRSSDSGAVVETATEVVSATPMGAVNDTGVTWDENSTAYSLLQDYSYYWTCDNSSDINSPQDCHQGRDATDNNDTDGYAGFNFTRLYESNGSVYTGTGDYSADPWGCVRDNVTGLVWEVKLPTSGVRFRDQSFTSYDMSRPTTIAFSDLTNELNGLNNNEGLCGYTTWRKPTIAEIQSIHTPSGSPYATGSDGDRNDGYQYLDLDYFPNTGTFSYSYWSDTAYPGNNSYLLAFSANQGDALAYLNYDNDAKIKLRLVVSDGNHTSNVWSGSRYEVNTTDGMITDLATGLVWMQCSLGQDYDSDSGTCSGSPTLFDTWKAALDKAAEDEYASSGWRLPNIKELSSLLDGSSGASSPYVYSKFGSGTYTDYDYWSSTPSRYGNSNDGTGYPYSLTVDFGDVGDGRFKNVHRDGSDDSAKYVRLVKSLRD